ncbi:MAG: hypothetical protein KDD53_02860, partial [Bdellovibrionales bacterium]|nr:hypothetical protein [Bdellovibrionales bacterium]
MSDYRQITDNFLAKRLDGLSRSDRRLVLRLLFACFIVLALFISLEIGGYLISTSRIDASAKNARLIEVSGNQRILTQQIAILAFTLVVAESDSLRDDIRSHINKHISGMKRNHQRLLSQDEELGLGAGLSPKAEALLISGDPSLDDEIKKY